MEVKELGAPRAPGQRAGPGCMGMSSTYGPGTRRVRYLEENVAAASITLTPAELAALDEAAPPGAASGDRYPTGQMPLLNH
jgi:hypothetical protein